MSTPHTPTPWTLYPLCKEEDQGKGELRGNILISNRPPSESSQIGDISLWIPVYASQKEIDEANAQLIVTAVNSYSTLKAEVENWRAIAKDYYTLNENTTESISKSLHGIIVDVDKVIAERDTFKSDNEAKQKRVEELEQNVTAYRNDNKYYVQIIARLEKALSFYADEKRYSAPLYNESDLNNLFMPFPDKGHVARKALDFRPHPPIDTKP